MEMLSSDIASLALVIHMAHKDLAAFLKPATGCAEFLSAVHTLLRWLQAGLKDCFGHLTMI